MGSNALTFSPRPVSLPPTRKLLLTVLLAPMVLVPVAVAVHLGAYDSFVDNPIAGFGMWGSFAIHMWTRPGRRECLATIVLALAMRIAWLIAVGERGYPGSLLIGMGIYLGFASLIAMATRSLGRAGERREISRRSLGVIALLTYLGFCLGFYLSFAKLVTPKKLDYYLFAFDNSLGIQPAFLAGRWLESSPFFYRVEWMVYNCLGLWFSILYAVHANARAKYPINVLKMLIVNALAGFSLYFLFPAMGPKYAFPIFPHLPAAVKAVPALLSGVPNAMPSLHFGGTLLIFWFSRPWKWLYRAMGLFVALTAFATLALGEHYLIDLVVAVPYALAVMAFSASLPDRRLPLTAGASLVAFWLAVLRIPHFYPLLSWTLVLATLAIAFALQCRLAERVWNESGRQTTVG